MMYHRKGRQHDPGGFGPSIIVFGLTVLIVLFAFLCSHCAKAQTLEITQDSDITGKMFLQTVADSSHPCIHVHAGVTVTIQFCVLFTNGWGIICDEGSRVIIDNCFITYFGVPMGPDWQSPAWWTTASFLVFVVKPAELMITHCRLEGNCAGQVQVRGDNNIQTNAFIDIEYNDFFDGFNAVQLAGVRDPNAWIGNNRIIDPPFHYHSDQINVFRSNGTTIFNNFLLCNPDAPLLPTSAGIQSGDFEDYQITVAGNIVLNGQQGGIIAYYGWGQVSVTDNTVLGIGSGYSYGMGGLPGYATYNNNTVGWWDPVAKTMHNYTGLQPGAVNTSLPASEITLGAEEALYGQWITSIVQLGEYIGPWFMLTPDLYYPQATDFAF